MVKITKKTTIEEIQKNPYMLTDLILNLVTGLPLESAVAIFCTIIDQLCGDNGLSSEETVGLYRHMAECAERAQKLFGPSPKRSL